MKIYLFEYPIYYKIISHTRFQALKLETSTMSAFDRTAPVTVGFWATIWTMVACGVFHNCMGYDLQHNDAIACVYFIATITACVGGAYIQLQLIRHGDAINVHIRQFVMCQLQGYFGSISHATISITRAISIVQLLQLLKSMNSLLMSTLPWQYHALMFVVDLLQYIPELGIYASVIRLPICAFYGEILQTLLSLVMICLRLIPGIKYMIQQHVYKCLFTQLQVLALDNSMDIAIVAFNPDNCDALMNYINQITDYLQKPSAPVNALQISDYVSKLLTNVHKQSKEVLEQLKTGHEQTHIWNKWSAMLGTIAILWLRCPNADLVWLCIAKLFVFVVLEMSCSVLSSVIIPKLETFVNGVNHVNRVGLRLVRVLLR